MKLYIVGWKRSGKDHAGEYLREAIGLEYESSSYFAAKHFIFSLMNTIGWDYADVDECFEDRHSNRKFWFDAITRFNTPDRNKEELQAARDRWSDCLVIWIDAEGRVEPESEDSCTITKDQADIIIDNKLGKEEFNDKLYRLAMLLEAYKKLV